eukprot:5314936-Pleurochrysis_carterae.AAC.2
MEPHQAVASSLSDYYLRLTKSAPRGMLLPQIDDHIPVLTTEETLQFAYKCKSPNLKDIVAMGNLTEQQASIATLLYARAHEGRHARLRRRLRNDARRVADVSPRSSNKHPALESARARRSPRCVRL